MARVEVERDMSNDILDLVLGPVLLIVGFLVVRFGARVSLGPPSSGTKLSRTIQAVLGFRIALSTVALGGIALLLGVGDVLGRFGVNDTLAIWAGVSSTPAIWFVVWFRSRRATAHASPRSADLREV